MGWYQFHQLRRPSAHRARIVGDGVLCWGIAGRQSEYLRTLRARQWKVRQFVVRSDPRAEPAIPIWFAGEALDEKIDEDADFDGEMACRRIQRVNRKLRRAVFG